MLECYLNQMAEHKPKTDTNDRGQPIYGAATTVKCRKQSKIKNVLSSQGQLISSEFIYYLSSETAVNAGDMLDGKIVITSSSWVDLNGKVGGYKAVV